MKTATRLILAAWMLLAAGCAAAQPSPGAATPVQTATLTPALTVYASPTRQPVLVRTAAASPSPLPTMTPTPLSYKVVKGDDMFGIALRYGIPLAALLTANPTVNPAFLSVGIVLQIPQVQATPKPGEATPEPATVDLAEPVCYPTAEGGLLCLVEASNPGEQVIENASASVVISAGESGALLQQVAYPLLYLLPPGKQAALGAYFPPPVAWLQAASARLDTAFYQPEGDVRYADVEILSEKVTILPDGLSARVEGILQLAADAKPVGETAVAAAAYDAQGRLVGWRRWESRDLFQAGGKLAFTLTVYSLGPQIARVSLAAEAQTDFTSLTPVPTATATPG